MDEKMGTTQAKILDEGLLACMLVSHTMKI